MESAPKLNLDSMPALAVSCPLCWAPTPEPDLRRVERAELGVLVRLAERDPFWRRQEGACPACVERARLLVKTATTTRP